MIHSKRDLEELFSWHQTCCLHSLHAKFISQAGTSRRHDDDVLMHGGGDGDDEEKGTWQGGNDFNSI